MHHLLLVLILLGQSQTKLCKYQVTVFRGGQTPICTYTEIGRITAAGWTKIELYTDIQTKVCRIGGHAILTVSETRGSAGMTLTGIAVRCNVPFLLPSDLKPRG